MVRLTIVRNEDAVAATAAERITSIVDTSLADRGSAVVCLTGGSTPQRLYERLAEEARAIEWTRVHLFWGDERHVPPDHPDSNFGMAHRALVAHVPVPAPQIHRMRGELPDATAAASAYEAELREGFARAGRRDQTFDLMLLGFGEDTHIASIFPGSELLAAGAGLPVRRSLGGGGSRLGSNRRVAAVWAAHLNAWRITLTPPAILDARAILMIVAGEQKAEAVRVAFEMPEDISRWPVHLLRSAADRVEWVADEAAAGRLRHS